MGRGHRGSHSCAVRFPDERGTEGSWLWGASWCGKPHSGSSMSGKPEGEDPLAYARRMADCPKCSAAIGKARLKQLGGRVKVEPIEIPSGSWGKRYKSCHQVVIDDVVVGHIIMDNGWGTVWELRELTPDTGRDFGSKVSDTPGRFSRVDADRTFQPIHCRSKEMMASAAFRLREKGELLTLPEQAVRREAIRVQRAADDAQREIDRAEAAKVREAREQRETERRTLAMDGLLDTLERTDLTNIQRAGLEAVKDIMEGKRA